METKTGYDLNSALENWRRELAAQGNLTAEVRLELETHLCDAMAGFRRRGLSDEESFWLARKRVGQPQQLGEEFVKADAAKAWGERLFWMALGIMVFWELTLMLTEAASVGLYFLSPTLHGYYERSGFWPVNVVVLIIGIALARGWLVQSMKQMWFLKNRIRLVSLVGILVLLTVLTQIEVVREGMLLDGYHHSAVTWAAWLKTFLHLLVGYLAYSIAPLIFLVLFFPAQNQKTPRQVGI